MNTIRSSLGVCVRRGARSSDTCLVQTGIGLHLGLEVITHGSQSSQSPSRSGAFAPGQVARGPRAHGATTLRVIAAAAARWQPGSPRLAALTLGLVPMTIAHRGHRAGLRCEVLTRCGRSPLSVEPNDGAQPLTILRDKYGRKVRHHLRRRGDQFFDR